MISSLKIGLAMAIVGSSVVAGKWLVQDFPVFLASELRFLVAVIILVPLCFVREGYPMVQKKDLFILFLQAFFGVFLFNVLMLYGLQHTTAMEAGVITSVLPAVTAGLSYLILREKLTKRIGLAIVLAMAGLIYIHVISSYTTGGNETETLYGNLLIGGAVVSESLSIILGKSVAQRVGPFTIATIVSVFGVVFFLPFSVFEALHFQFTEVTLADWGVIVYLGIIVTVLAFILMYQGVKKVSASTAGILTAVLPLSSMVFAAMFLHEQLAVNKLFGMCFVLTAIYLISNDPEKMKEPDV